MECINACDFLVPKASFVVFGPRVGIGDAEAILTVTRSMDEQVSSNVVTRVCAHRSLSAVC